MNEPITRADTASKLDVVDDKRAVMAKINTNGAGSTATAR